MKTVIQTMRLGLAALLLAITVQSVSAAPAQTGIRGQTLLQQSFAVEVAPGVWVGDTWWVSFPASFRVLSAHSGREITHFSTGDFGSFEVSLPPGKYVVVPDTFPGYAPFTGSVEVTVTAKHFTDVSIVYGSSPPVSP
jgi:hypothetical protein